MNYWTAQALMNDHHLGDAREAALIAMAGLALAAPLIAHAIGAPILTAITGRVPRKPLLVGLMALFTIGNLVAWLAPGRNMLTAMSDSAGTCSSTASDSTRLPGAMVTVRKPLKVSGRSL